MDSLTHIALGACIGEAILGRRIGRRALLWGSLAHSFPDIDVISALWLDIPANLLAHRGITHSIAGAVIITLFFHTIALRTDKFQKVKPVVWMYFFSAAVFSHLFIDAFNSYGVGWFEPFSDYRISFNAVYVADPLFSIVPIFAALALLFIQPKSMLRKIWWRVSFLFTGIYLITCIANKTVVNKDVKKALKLQNISYNRYFSTPAPFQNLLWYVVAGNDSGFYVGYRSVLDRSNSISVKYYPVNNGLVAQYVNQYEINQLARFSQQWYTIEQWHDTLVFNDLRFGQARGWDKSPGRFVFHYYLGDSLDNRLVMQRGRLEGWNGHSVRVFLHKVVGE